MNWNNRVKKAKQKKFTGTRTEEVRIRKDKKWKKLNSQILEIFGIFQGDKDTKVLSKKFKICKTW